ncbi:Flp family type IVb pilin [Mesorhizobium sp. CAU 1741]|uniref:Flp family type IVb pilin n=1 Tax=Mesorhizobium sp. CAU 1741 TaxID=3140366 RepID=UPI00325B3744
MLKKFHQDRRGATALEYGLIVAVLSLVIIGGFSQAVDIMQGNFETKAEIIKNAGQ